MGYIVLPREEWPIWGKGGNDAISLGHIDSCVGFLGEMFIILLLVWSLKSSCGVSAGDLNLEAINIGMGALNSQLLVSIGK